MLLNVRWFRLLSANRAAALDFMQLIARAVFVPAFVFLGGTLLRARLNFPRPYEQPGFTPLVPKETHGKSFPSPPRPERRRAHGLRRRLLRDDPQRRVQARAFTPMPAGSITR